MGQPFADITPWPPRRFTAPLSAEFPSAFDGYAALFVLVWRRAFGYTLEHWQVQLLRAVLEVYPEGHPRAGQLRWRQVVISLGRQNGKTEIAAALGLWGLLMKAVPTIVGIASRAEQAQLVYKRTMAVIRSTPALAAQFAALTSTRGIRTASGGEYQIKAAKSDALQGIPIDLGLVDEVHIIRSELWTDLVNGLGGRPNCLVVGITTAGDADSTLLKHLYGEGDKAIDRGGLARFGFFLWEAPESRIPDDDATLGRWLALANPAVAEGRVDLETVIEEVRSMPEADAIRYRLNRFVTSSSSFLSGEGWARGFTRDPFPDARPIFTFDRTPDWGHASIGAFAKTATGETYCDLVASIVRPTLGQLADIASRLAQHNPITFGMDGYVLRDLGKELEMRGLPVTITTQADMLNGSALFYSKVVQNLIRHPGHSLLSMQIPRTVRKNVGEGFRVSRVDSSIEIDAVVNHIIGVQLAETQRETPLQIF